MRLVQENVERHEKVEVDVSQLHDVNDLS